MKNAISILVGFLLGGCAIPAEVIEGPGEGITYPNQGVSPLPWVHVIPSERALAFQSVDFNVISNQIHYDMGFIPHRKILRNVRLVLVDYTILPHENAEKSVIPAAPDVTPAPAGASASAGTTASAGTPAPTKNKGIAGNKNKGTIANKNKGTMVNDSKVTTVNDNKVTTVNKMSNSRPQRYFMTISFYEFDNRPPCPALFEVTASIRKATIPPQEAMRLIARDIVEEFHALSKVSLPVPQKKIILNLD